MTQMLRTRATCRALIPLIAVAIAVSVTAGTAGAQTISNVTIAKNGTNSVDENSTSSANPRFDRKSTVAVSSTATSVDARYAFLVAADYDGFQILGNNRAETLTPSYTISFQVTAPGAYKLNVSTALRGDLNRIADGSGGNAQASIGAVTGAQTGGTVSSGALGLPDNGDLGNAGGAGNVVINQAGTAVISGVSNGVPITHTLTFSGFNPTCTSTVSLFGTNAPECAVRGGISSATPNPNISAGVYPGSPARNAATQATDGHTVSITLVSLCGNGTIDPGVEDCDLSAQNGNADVCCSTSCKFKTSASVCRGQNGICDAAESCTGSAALCPADLVQPTSTLCRGADDICDQDDFCDGVNKLCGADIPAPSTKLCRGATDICDKDDFCDGTNHACPTDEVAPTTKLCRPINGVCDAEDFCDGAQKACPPDQVLPSSVLCRPSAGFCDVDDYCPGDAPDCSADARKPNTVVCRPAGDECDLDDTCNGDVDCGADIRKPDTDNDGECDEHDNCPDVADPTLADDDDDGVGNVCDPCTNIGIDILAPIVTLKRINTPQSDDTLKFEGKLTVPTTPPINPVAKGLRFRFEDPDGAAVLDVTIPPGAYNAALRSGWKVKPNNWKYVNIGKIVPLVQGINSVSITQSKTVPGELKFSIKGKRGFYPVFPEELPLKASFVLDTPYAQTGQCGEVLLNSASCLFDQNFTKLQCK